MTYEQIKKNYDRKLWNDIMVSKAVNKVITEVEEFKSK